MTKLTLFLSCKLDQPGLRCDCVKWPGSTDMNGNLCKRPGFLYEHVIDTQVSHCVSINAIEIYSSRTYAILIAF